MFNIGAGEFLVLGVLALLVLGPDQLPKVAAQAGRALRQLRRMADNAKRDIREGLGPEYQDFDVEDLNPRRFIQKHFWEASEESTSLSVSARLNGRRPPFDDEAT